MKLRQHSIVYCVAALMVIACVSSLEAQGRRGGGQQGGGGRGGFGGGPGGAGSFGRGGGPGGGMMGGGGASELALLRRADVRKEIETTDDQNQQLENLDVRGMMGDVFSGLRDLDPEQRREKMAEAMSTAQKKIQEKVGSILLPHQATRLSELTVQFAMRTPEGLVRGTVADKLGLSDQDREQLREKARKLREEMEKKLSEELIKQLSPSQQAKIKQLRGKDFTFVDPPRDPGSRGNRGGGRQRGN